ncbi:hypothetical protein BDW60DRAFT_177443 [Aspergillus nidulans var. acristatus]
MPCSMMRSGLARTAGRSVAAWFSAVFGAFSRMMTSVPCRAMSRPRRPAEDSELRSFEMVRGQRALEQNKEPGVRKPCSVCARSREMKLSPIRVSLFNQPECLSGVEHLHQ